jgi:ASCH domain-containing protein
MKALSIRQPNVEAILSGRKTIEVRGTATRHRGDLLIHASRVWRRAERERLAVLRERGIAIEDPGQEARGAICGVVQLVGCRRMTADDWAPALMAPDEDGTWWAWELAEPERFPVPIPYKGHLFLFDVPDAELARAALAADERALALTEA